jgi:site-specific DNA recombinase
MIRLKNTKDPERVGPANVLLYVRVSTDRQAQKEDGSLDTQLDRLTAFVEYKRSTGHEWTVTEKLVEGEREGKRHGKSAKNTERPALQRLLELARAQLIDVVVITKIDRISRSVIDFLQLVEELDQLGVKVVSLRENIDLTTPAGRFQTVLMIALAQQERELTSVRVKEKVGWRVEKGLPLGPPPMGFRMDGKIFGIHEPYAAHVRAADALYLEGESVDKLVVEFRKRGYRTPGGSFYTKQVLCRMLRNEVYAAKQDYEGKLYDAQWKPIRSWETHVRLGQLMDKNDRRNGSGQRQSREYVYLLQGLLRCGLCGHKMSPRPGRGMSGQYYPYYFCGEAEKSVGGTCPRVYVPAETLDLGVLEFMKLLHLKPEHIRAIAEQANEFTSETLTKIMSDLERVRAQLASVRSKLSRLVDVLTDGGKEALASVRERMKGLEAERAELEETEARLKGEYAAEKTEEIRAAEQIKTLAQFQELVTENAEKPDRLKALLPRFLDYVVFHADGKGEGRLEVALFPEPVASAPEIVRTGVQNGPPLAGGSQMVGPARFELATSCTPVCLGPSRLREPF